MCLLLLLLFCFFLSSSSSLSMDVPNCNATKKVDNRRKMKEKQYMSFPHILFKVPLNVYIYDDWVKNDPGTTKDRQTIYHTKRQSDFHPLKLLIRAEWSRSGPFFCEVTIPCRRCGSGDDKNRAHRKHESSVRQWHNSHQTAVTNFRTAAARRVTAAVHKRNEVFVFFLSSRFFGYHRCLFRIGFVSLPRRVAYTNVKFRRTD